MTGKPTPKGPQAKPAAAKKPAAKKAAKPTAKPAAKKARGPRGAYNTAGRNPPKSAQGIDPDEPLNERERAFVQAYTTGPTAGHAQDACRLAGYAESSILTRPYDLLARPNVAKAIHEAQARVRDIAEQEAGISLARVVAQIGRLGFFRVQDLLDDKGALKDPKDWPEDASAAIAGIEVFEEYEGVGKDRRYKGQTRKVKLLPRTTALDQLMKHLGGYERDNGQRGDAATKALAELTQAISGMQGDDCRLPIARPATDPGA